LTEMALPHTPITSSSLRQLAPMKNGVVSPNKPSSSPLELLEASRRALEHRLRKRERKPLSRRDGRDAKEKLVHAGYEVVDGLEGLSIRDISP